jgi:SAM-dependent methyltransferase
MVAARTNPKRWLDVGAGHGHFCLVAADTLPDTRFEGLDLSRGIVEAERRGWIERAYVGLFPETADELKGVFDIVSMHHYLEHTREPADEIAAAATVLEPGGYLLIEAPNPDCTLARRLGWLWGPWFQPQHQHFLSTRNLATLLAHGGFTVVAEERGPAHQPCDMAFAMLLLTNRLAGRPAKPWLGRQSRLQRVRRGATYIAFAPLLIVAVVADRAVAPIVRRVPGGPNTYRVLARKD